jgi:excisionase family DNA binding protein
MVTTNPDTTLDTALLLTAPEAARRLSVSTRTIYNLFETGSLRRLKVGRSCRISATDLAQYVDTLRQAEQS